MYEISSKFPLTLVFFQLVEKKKDTEALLAISELISEIESRVTPYAKDIYTNFVRNFHEFSLISRFASLLPLKKLKIQRIFLELSLKF